MLQKFTLWIFSVGILMLAGCSHETWFRDRANDYVKVESCAPLKVPADLHAQPFSEEYQIPKS